MNMKIIYSLHNQLFNWHIIAVPVERVEPIWNHVTNGSKLLLQNKRPSMQLRV